MKEGSFSEEDLRKVKLLMKTVADKAQFTSSINGFVDLYNLIDHMNKHVVPKIEAHVFDIQQINKKDKENG